MSAAQDLLNVLSALMSPDNSHRRQAETYFGDQLESNLIFTLEGLIQIFANPSVDFIARSMAGVLLRRALESKSKDINVETTTVLRQMLLTMWKSETNATLLKRLSHVMAQSAAGSSWLDLLPTVISHANATGTPAVLIPPLTLIEIIADYCPEDILTHLAAIGTFLGTFISSSNEAVQVACARAACACIVALDDDNARNSFKPALQPIINVLGNTLSRGEEADACSIMESLVSIAQIQPIFFKGAVDNVVAAMLTVAGSSDLEFSTRFIALELMVTLTETAPALARRCAGLLEGLVPLSMSLALEIDESEAEWVRGKYSEELCEDNGVVGEEAIERAAAGMGGRVLAGPVLTLVQQYFSRPDMEHRRAAVACLSRLAEGASQVFKQYLDTSVQMLVAALSDSSSRVRYQSIQAIGRFAALFPTSIAELVDAFLPRLTALLAASDTCDRVRGHCASAMINLTDPDNCEATVLQKHLEPLLTALVACLQSAALEVQAPCLVLLGCVAKVSEEAFAPYYCAFMPGIKSILRAATAPEQAVLRGKAMECAGIVGEAVGAETFAADALEIMQILIGAIGQDEDSTFDYALPACARISKALGPQFEPYLPVVMGPLLAGATQEIKFSMEDADEDDAEGEVTRDEENGTESAVITLGGGVRKRVTLNTHAVQQKNQAARMLFEFASSMKGHLKSYLPPTMKALLALVTDKHSNDVRSSASLAVAKAFEAYIHAVQSGFCAAGDLSEVLIACLSKLQESLKGEVNPTSRACAAEALRDILAACFTSGTEQVDGTRTNILCKPEEPVALELVKDLLKRCKDSFDRRQEREAAFNRNEGVEAEDKDAFAEEIEEEDELLTNLADALGQLLKLYGPAFMPVFDTLVVPVFAPFLAPSQSAEMQIIAVCVLDDAIEFGGDAAHKYIPQALGAFIHGMKSENLVLRQSSVYGIAQAARAAPAVFVQHISGILPVLMSLATDPAAKEEEHEGITENAVYALGIISATPFYRSPAAATQWGGAQPAQTASLWLRGLPLRADEQEAKQAHRQLCDAVETGDRAVTGENYSNLPQLLRIFAEVLAAAARASVSADDGDAALAHPNTVQRMQGLVRQLSSGLAPQQMQAAFSTLTGEQQQALQAVM